MGTLVAIYCENKRRFFPCADKPQLNADGVRRVAASRYRYCLGSNYFYVPADHPELEETDRLCWVRARDIMDFEELDKLADSNLVINGGVAGYDIRIGNVYCKRRREIDGVFVEVDNFVGEQLYDGLSENPEVLSGVSRDDFEDLCAELFVRRGFDVDVFRKSKDGGIDFIAVKADDDIPRILAVQCKQPDVREGKPRRSLGRPVVQQIYGAAKAWDLDGAIGISGSTYSREAAKFAALKPDEISVYGEKDLADWLTKYRWNNDE